MELTTRQRSVLLRIVERYIKAGEPVASRQVARSSEIDFSPATVRSVMSDLEDAGLLERSHASAGCVPTDHAFRVYVDSLQPGRRLAPRTRSTLEHRIQLMRRELVEDLSWVPQLVADVTREAGVAVRPMGEEQELEGLSLVPFGDGRVLGVIVTGDGSIERRVMSLDVELSREQLQRIENALNGLLVGRAIGRVRQLVESPPESILEAEDRALASAVNAAEHSLGDRFSRVLRALFEEASEDVEVAIAGTENLLMSGDFEKIERLRSLLVLFGDHGLIVREWRRFLRRGQTQVIIGRESELTASASLGMVATLFFRGGRRVGAVGVVGPRRMDYQRIVPVVEYIGNALTTMLDDRGVAHG